MKLFVQQTSDALIGMYKDRRLQFAAKPEGELRDIIHECETARMSREWSVRAAAEINRTEALWVL
jgi:hypothetical protein